MVDTTMTQSIRKYLKALKERGIPVRYGVLFGSHARNQPHTWSDIDLAVISEQFDGQLNRENVALLWHVAARVDSRIEPVAVGQQQFESGSDRAIVEIVHREGQIITLEFKAFPRTKRLPAKAGRFQSKSLKVTVQAEAC